MGATTEEKKEDVAQLINGITILPFNQDVAEQAAEIYHELKRTNQLIEFRDIFIVAKSIAYNFPLLTINKKHFTRIKGLSLS